MEHLTAYSVLGLLDPFALPGGDPIYDRDRLLLRRTVGQTSGFASLAGFNAALTEHVRNHPTLLSSTPSQATSNGCHTANLVRDDAAPVNALREAIKHCVAHYMTEITADSALPYFAVRPTDWRYDILGVVLRHTGRQRPHVHPNGFLSGVYYPADLAANSGDAGAIVFGHSTIVGPDGGFLAPKEPLVVRPFAGLMVLFPSYFWHHTIAFAGQRERISVAFDVIAR